MRIPRPAVFLLLPGLLAIWGCAPAAPPEFRLNEVELLKQQRQSLGENEEFEPGYRQQVQDLVTALFGTPDEPALPLLAGADDPAGKIISLENLKLAAGSVASDREDRHAGLWREHCAHCHGVTGDGNGPTASMLNPYPRDFRLGKFKFKSSPLRQAPTDADLEKVLRNGIPGTGMPSFHTLPPEHVAALVDYVKYLTMRGDFERYLLAMLPELQADGLPLLNLRSLLLADDDQRDAMEEQIEVLGMDVLMDRVLERWIDPASGVTEVPPAPPEIAVDHPGHAALVSRGRDLFHGAGSCVQCHGDTGLGDGQTENYDDWTNDWLKTPGVNPEEPATYADFLDAGALPPRKIRPRNLNLPVYRGGGSPEEIWLRIANGIEGTPMPSSPALKADEVWALVAWVRSLPYGEPVSGN